MLLSGRWHRFEDGVVRPVIDVAVVGRDGQYFHDDFLVDCGSDRTVLTAAMFVKLGLPGRIPTDETSLVGLAGSAEYLLVDTALALPRDDGGVAIVRGAFAALTDATAADLCVLGRDVINNFDLLLSFRRNAVHLLAGRHQYRVEQI